MHLHTPIETTLRSNSSKDQPKSNVYSHNIFFFGGVGMLVDRSGRSVCFLKGQGGKLYFHSPFGERVSSTYIVSYIRSLYAYILLHIPLWLYSVNRDLNWIIRFPYDDFISLTFSNDVSSSFWLMVSQTLE